VNLKLQTDFGLRILIYLARTGRRATLDEIAQFFDISREHLVKVGQALTAHGWVQSTRGRSGGLDLAVSADDVDVGDVVAALEGRNGVLQCVAEPDVCRLEPGCRLRRRLMVAEDAFYAALSGLSLADLIRRPASHHGLTDIT